MTNKLLFPYKRLYAWCSNGRTRFLCPLKRARDRKYAKIFKNEGIRVCLWTATRDYQCMKCRKHTFDATSIKPKCSQCTASERALRYFGIKDAKFEEYKEALPRPFKNRTSITKVKILKKE